MAIDFNTQADVLINTKAAARVAGGTLMDRPEWITVGPGQERSTCTLTNNGGRQVTDAANPRVTNPHGHIIRWKETGDSPLAVKFTWEILLLAGDPSIAAANLKGNMVGDTFSSPDGIRVDPKGRLWVQTDAGTGHQRPPTSSAPIRCTTWTRPRARSKRFLVGPHGCEITGLAYTPDLDDVLREHPASERQMAERQPPGTLDPRSSSGTTKAKSIGA